MSEPALAKLLAVRNAALDRPHRGAAWNALTATQRAKEEATIARRVAAEEAIVAILRQRPGPVAVGKVVLHLTRDLMHFVEMDPKTRRPVYVKPSCDFGWKTILYRYPNGAEVTR